MVSSDASNHTYWLHSRIDLITVNRKYYLEFGDVIGYASSLHMSEAAYSRH